ncbi:MAG: hypothetical protein ABSC92_18805 [Rhizomicrobium sp.]|jgi:hypothetical protein
MTLPFQQFARLIAISGLLFLGCCSSMPTLEAEDQCTDASVFDPGRDPLCLDQYVPAKSQDDPVAVNATLTALQKADVSAAQAKADATKDQTALDTANANLKNAEDAAATTPAATLALAQKRVKDATDQLKKDKGPLPGKPAAPAATSNCTYGENVDPTKMWKCTNNGAEDTSAEATANAVAIAKQQLTVAQAAAQNVTEQQFVSMKECFNPARDLSSNQACVDLRQKIAEAQDASIPWKSQLGTWPSAAATTTNPSANNSKSQQSGSTSSSGSTTYTISLTVPGKTQTTPSSGTNKTQNGTKTSNGNSNSGSGAGQVTNVRLGNLYRMYEQSETRCLYWKSKRNVWFQFADNSYNFADLAVAAIVPILAFTNSSNESIGLVGAFVALFGGQLKSAVNGVTGDGTSSTADFSQTQSEMQTFYKLYSSDPYFQDDGKAKYNPFMSGNDSSDSANATLAVQEQDQAHQIFHLFKLGMEYSCYSNLSFSSGSKSGNSNSSGGSSNGGQGSSDDSTSQ